jgi:S1-C subfamily serine protease
MSVGVSSCVGRTSRIEGPMPGHLASLALFALIPPFYLDCVVAIGQRTQVLENGVVVQKWVPMASGFLYGDFAGKDDRGASFYRTFLVTNRHVFTGKQSLELRFNPEDSKPAKAYTILLIQDGKPLWYSPPDPALDVAVTQIDVSILRKDGIQAEYFQSDKMSLDMAEAKDIGVTEGDGAFVLGFPMQLVGGERNFVIVRQATIARIRDTIAGVSNDFLLDTFIFPGNSGGPVILRPEVNSIQGTRSQSRSMLIGLVSSYVPYQDTAISQQTGRPRIIFEENSGLTNVVTVDSIKLAIAEAIRKITVSNSTQAK